MPPSPTAPTCLVAVLAPPASVDLAWKNGKHAASLQVQRALGAGSFATIATLAPSLNQYRDNTVALGATYRYQIVAVNGSSTATSGIVPITVGTGGGIPVPAPPVLTLPTPAPVTSPDGRPVPVTFTIGVSGGAPPVGPVIATPASGSVFPVGTTTVAVSVTDALGQRTTGSFPVVVSFVPVVTSGPGWVSLAWDPSAGATGYRLRYGTASGVYTSLEDVGPLTTATVYGLASGTTYYFVVDALNAAGESSPSNEVSVTIA